MGLYDSPLDLFSVLLIWVIAQETSAVKWIVFCADDESLSKRGLTDTIDVLEIVGLWIKLDQSTDLKL